MLCHCFISLCESREIRKLDYDYATETASFDTMGESVIYAQVRDGLGDFLKAAIWNLAGTIDDGITRNRVQKLRYQGAANMVTLGYSHRCPDFSFAESVPGDVQFSSFFVEIC